MIVNPEIYAWLNRQNKVKSTENKQRTQVTKGEASAEGGEPEQAPKVQSYTTDIDERGDNVDYLNDRKSKFNCYA